LASGAIIHNTALQIYRAKKAKRGKSQGAGGAGPRGARKYAAIQMQAVPVSDPGLDRSDETAIAVNPLNPKNIVAGAATFDGNQYTNSAYVTMDGGSTWKTVTALSDTDEGAGLAFDDSGNCYYVTMQGGLQPCCAVSTDGGLTWGVPAHFGFGDKTAVAARGQIALCGFDRINTEACAFTLDGGATWTVHDFTDRGLGTAPLISYDQMNFYIIYAALDRNLKLYHSPDQGQTWNGPFTIVAGNSYVSALPGPLGYQGPSLASPGTNVAIDLSGRLHVLYIDSTHHVPMYTFSDDHGVTWSAPVNVNPERAYDSHMFPCLASNKDGDLVGGSMVYDTARKMYSILRHVKPKGEDEWQTSETDSGPWPAAGPSPGFRIGFGDYFDCDTVPQCGISAMGWSETPNGQEPWQTWVRVLEPICDRPRKEKCACSVDLPEIPVECVSPAAPPWLHYSRCIPFYEEKIVSDPNPVSMRPGAEFGGESILQFRIVYEHCLRMIGRQQGPLLFTTTLLPKERQRLFHFERYRRVRGTQDAFSVQTSFRQYISALFTSHVAQSASLYSSSLSSTRESGDSGLGIAGFLGVLGGLFGLGGESSSNSGSSFASASVEGVVDTFHQIASGASLAVDTERSTIVSTFEDKEQQDVTVREIENRNDCHAVSYFVRKVLEVYTLQTTVTLIQWRLVPQGVPGIPSPAWRDIKDGFGVPQSVRDRIKADLAVLPAVGTSVGDSRPIALPTDGTVFEPELAHCSSCEPASLEREAIGLEKARAKEIELCARAEMARLEVRRRKLLLEKGDLSPFEPVGTATGLFAEGESETAS
jgi:thermitase